MMFVTPFGRYRYKVLPQGFLASNDTYCKRYNKITRGVRNLMRCVDDTLLWETSMEENFFKTCEYLSLAAGHGIMFNLKKFQFCQKTVEFLGFLLTDTGMKSIRDFPHPTDISGVRSFFGLVEQVSWAFSKCDNMVPFRTLLSCKEEFKWSDELQVVFEKAKENIVDSVRKGVSTFNVNRSTILNTDWSKIGISFAIFQKHCNSVGINIRCCPEGWRLVLCG